MADGSLNIGDKPERYSNVENKGINGEPAERFAPKGFLEIIAVMFLL